MSKKQKLLREKRCLRVPLTFSWYVSWWKILCCSSRRQRRLICSRHQPSETPPTPLTPWPPPSEPHPLPVSPTRPHLDASSPTRPPAPPPFPMDNMHGNLRFDYVQQPCLDYVLFLGFSEVISFSLLDTNSGPEALCRSGAQWAGASLTATLPNPGVNSSKLVFLLLLTSVFQSHIVGEGGGGAFLCSIRSKTSADYCRYDFVLEKYTVISESVGTCSRA